MKMSFGRWILALVFLFVLLFATIQLIPYGRDHANPPVVTSVAWDSAETEKTVQAACYDCHSNQTTWYWYANVAPFSWLVTRDVLEAREAFNFDDMTVEAGQVWVNVMVDKINKNQMPPPQYSAIHPEARFSTAEKQQLVEGLLATFK